MEDSALGSRRVKRKARESSEARLTIRPKIATTSGAPLWMDKTSHNQFGEVKLSGW